MEKLRIGIVGAGAIAQRNAREAANSGVAEVVSVFDVNRDASRALAKVLKVPEASSYERMLDDANVEAVLLSLPHHLHKPTAVLAAENGKHVLVEKPIANNLDEAEAMIQACRAAGVKLTVNYSFRFLPKVRQARQLVEQGGLGDVCGMQISLHQYKDRGYWAGGKSNSPDDWRALKEKCGGGFLIMNVCHILDYMFFISGEEPDRVYAEYATLASGVEVEDIISVSFRMTNGAVGNVSGSSIMRGMNDDTQYIWGSNGSMRIDDGGIEFYSTRPALGRRPGRNHRLRKFASVSWTIEWIKDFVAAIRNDREPEVGTPQAWSNLAFIQAAYESLDQGRPVSVRPLPEGFSE